MTPIKMFTGIIKAAVKPIKITKTSVEMTFVFPIPKGWELEKGESINIDGICSTVMDLKKQSFSVFYMSETLKKTSLTSLPQDHLFNLERSLSASDLMGGHFVSGHIDTTGKLRLITKEGESKILTINIPEEFSKYIIYKGSITVNGVSLTVTDVKNDSFSVSLIPHTLKNTNLGDLKIDDLVNIEVDILAKYIEKLFIRQ